MLVLEWVLAIALAASLRLTARAVLRRGRVRHSNAPPVVLVGAGDCGELLLRDLERAPNANMRVAAIMDDDSRKHGAILHGVRIAGPIDEPSPLAFSRRPAVSVLSSQFPRLLPRASAKLSRSAAVLVSNSRPYLLLQDLAEGRAQVSVVRDIRIEDLLRREPVELDMVSSGRCWVVDAFVTGAAGSIGSELVRQIAASPAHIALLDHSENGLFHLERELRVSQPNLNISVHVASIQNQARLGRIFDQVRPHVVYHAAAHKHVPMMELKPVEATRNNIFATRLLADARQRSLSV